MLLPMSRIHSNATATHNKGLKGKANKQILPIIAPMRKNGFLLPNFGDHVLSLIAPIIGCTINPVIGPAILRIGNKSSAAPKYKKIGFIAVCCKPNEN